MTKKEMKSNGGLKVLNDMVVIEEDPIDWEKDTPSGLTTPVVDMLKSGKLVIPEVAEFYAKKYPCTGKVVALGPRCKHGIPLGSKVLFARHGGMREKVQGKDYVFIREADVHAILD